MLSEQYNVPDSDINIMTHSAQQARLAYEIGQQQNAGAAGGGAAGAAGGAGAAGAGGAGGAAGAGGWSLVGFAKFLFVSLLSVAFVKTIIEENAMWGPAELNDMPAQVFMVLIVFYATRTKGLTPRQCLYLVTVCFFMKPLGWFWWMNPVRWLGLWVLFWAVNYIEPDAGHTETTSFWYALAHIFACLCLGMTWQGTTILTSMIGVFEFACKFMPMLETVEFVFFWWSTDAAKSDWPSENCMRKFGWIFEIDCSKTPLQQRKDLAKKRNDWWPYFWGLFKKQ